MLTSGSTPVRSTGNTLNDWAGKRELVDESETIPDSPLPPQKGIKYYWVSTNSWSIDGLSGMKQVKPLASTDIIRTKMMECGLPTSSLDTSRTFNWILVWLLGVMMGMAFLTVTQKSGAIQNLDIPQSARRLLDFRM